MIQAQRRSGFTSYVKRSDGSLIESISEGIENDVEVKPLYEGEIIEHFYIRHGDDWWSGRYENVNGIWKYCKTTGDF